MKQDTLIRKVFLKGNPDNLNSRVDSSSLTSANNNQTVIVNGAGSTTTNGATVEPTCANGNNSENNNHTIIGNGAGSTTANGANGLIAEPKTSNNDRKINCPCL